jgi:hypothetical protein
MQKGLVDPAFKLGRSFLHNPLPYEDFREEIIPGTGRIYYTPAGDFKSVTTVLKDLPDDDPEWRDKWAARVGEEEAVRVTARGSTRGRNVHDMVERYLKGQPDFAAGEMPANLAFFKELRPIIDEGVGTIFGVEIPLYSARLGTAGRTDLVCGYRGFNTVMDWKNSNNPWPRGRQKKALIQAATYATMIEETHGINIPWVTVVIVSESDKPQVVREPTDDWREWVERVFARREFQLTS